MEVGNSGNVGLHTLGVVATSSEVWNRGPLVTHILHLCCPPQRVVSAASLLREPLGFLTVQAQLVQGKNMKGAFLTGLNNIEGSLKVPYLWAMLL